MSRGVSVIVPVFNSEETLLPLLHRLQAVLGQIGEPFEVLLVNDGSTDASWSRIEALCTQSATVRGIRLMRNYGQHNALLCGIRAACHDVIVTLDDDLQNPPEEIPRLLERLASGADVVYGTPERGQHGVWRNLASWATKLALQATMGVETARKVSAFRAFRTILRDAFASFHGPFVSIDVLLTWGTSRFDAVAVRQDERAGGETSYTFRKLLTHALNMMTGFSTLPLQLGSILGFALTAFGIVVLAFVLGRYFLEGGSVPGFPFLASIVAIFSGAQLFTLGIIGEYLARMHFRLMDKPPYAIREQRGGEQRGNDA